jgi:cytochrome c biogenesis protein ResB
MLLVVLMTGVLLGGALVIGGVMLSQTELPEDDSAVAKGGQGGQAIPQTTKKKQVGGHVRLEASGHKTEGPRLNITSSQFRDQVERMPYYYDNDTALRWFYSGRKFVDAFGPPHRVRTVGEDTFYYWTCSDGTLKVVTKASNVPLAQRNSQDGSSLIVYRIDDEFY